MQILRPACGRVQGGGRRAAGAARNGNAARSGSGLRVQVEGLLVDVAVEEEAGHAQCHAGVDRALDAECAGEAPCLAVAQGHVDEARIELADAHAFGHERGVLVRKVRVDGSEGVVARRVDQQQRRGAPQDAVRAVLLVGAPHAVERRQVAVGAGHDAAQPRPHERMAQLAGDRGEGVERVAGDQPQLCGAGDERERHLLAVAGRGGAVRRLDDAQQLVVRHGIGRESAVGAPDAAQEQHLIGCGQRAAVGGVDLLGRKVVVVHGIGRARRDAVAARDAAVGGGHGDRAVRCRLEYPRGANPGAAAATAAGGGVDGEDCGHMVSVVGFRRCGAAARGRSQNSRPVSPPSWGASPR